MSYQSLTYEKVGRVAVIKFNRPDKLNAFDTSQRREFVQAAREANADKDVWVVLLGAHGRAFSAGADLSEPNNEFNDGHAVEDMLNLEYKPGIMQIADSRKPWVCAVNGACAGVGYSYAMACDMVMMADNAFLYQPFSAIGLVPDGGSTWLIPAAVGHKRAFELMALGEKLTAEKALEWGMINRVVPADSLQDDALALAQDLAERSPLALRHTKAALRYATEHSLSESITYEASLQRMCIDSEDSGNAVRAFFNKEKYEWQNK